MGPLGGRFVRLLVTGGAGYVGSVVAAHLLASGHEVTVLDDLSTGHADAVPAGATLVREDVRGADALLRGGYDGVLHFAAKSLVSESILRPRLYWEQNLGGTLALLDAMRRHGCPRLVFSSTAAVYGEPEASPIGEDAPARPTNPYGASKLAVDTAIGEYSRCGSLGAVSLRYFNVAGAVRALGGGAPGGRDGGHHSGSCQWLGERHDPETHVIPLVLEVALGRREQIRLFGTDYPTPDGTCVRDYIHVDDLARAHLLALEAAVPGDHAIYNLGNGSGFSVREVVEVARAVTGRPIAVESAPRREGDPAVLVASGKRAREELGWVPQRAALHDMVADAWKFLRSVG